MNVVILLLMTVVAGRAGKDTDGKGASGVSNGVAGDTFVLSFVQCSQSRL